MTCTCSRPSDKAKSVSSIVIPNATYNTVNTTSSCAPSSPSDIKQSSPYRVFSTSSDDKILVTPALRNTIVCGLECLKECFQKTKIKK